MVRTNLKYDAELSACEAEDLRFTGEVQSGIGMVVLRDAQVVAATPDCSDLPVETIEALANRPADRKVGSLHDYLATEDGGNWLRHRAGSHQICERFADKGDAPDITADEIEDLIRRAGGNIWKLGFHVCDMIAEVTGCERVMIYRFHEDWSGEVIAERVSGSLEPYLGLRYPPTDIPRQAREQYATIKSRHIFTTTRNNRPLVACAPMGQPVDLTHAVGRSVSPYHIEYLRNMGSASTASCGLMHDGKLWGLLSLHYSSERPPSIAEFSVLQDFSAKFCGMLDVILLAQKISQKKRARIILEKFVQTLNSTNDPFRTLIASDLAFHRLASCQGLALVLGDEVCSTGTVASSAFSKMLCDHVGKSLHPDEPLFMDHLPPELPLEGRGKIAGFAMVRLADVPDAFCILYRTGVNQSVSWGGDPRRVPATDMTVRYHPRKSFDLWVEVVEGRSPVWRAFDKLIVRQVFEQMLDFFDVSGRELVLLFRHGMGQCNRDLDLLRTVATDRIERLRAGPSVGVETTTEKGSRIIAFNIEASDAFALADEGAGAYTLGDIERRLGITLSEGQSERFIASMITANNGIRNFEVNTDLIYEHQDLSRKAAIYRIMIFEFRDVTDRKRLEQALQAARDRALNDMQLSTEFHAQLSHEFKTPLNAVIGISALLQARQDLLPDEKTRKLVDLIVQASDHLKDLIDNTLIASRAKGSFSDPDKAVNALEPVLQEALAILTLSAQSAGITIETDIAPDLTIQADSRALRQILLNIIGNAIKYNIPQGRIRITASPQGTHMVRITISDTGIGMTEEQLSKCMQPYRRFGDGDGAGLGLSIVLHLVSMIGGVVTMDSRIGAGTEVKFLLPSRSEPKALSPARGAPIPTREGDTAQ